jgi:hypothetical protein
MTMHSKPTRCMSRQAEVFLSDVLKTAIWHPNWPKTKSAMAFMTVRLSQRGEVDGNADFDRPVLAVYNSRMISAAQSLVAADDITHGRIGLAKRLLAKLRLPSIRQGLD